jgi:hypothetical protein
MSSFFVQHQYFTERHVGIHDANHGMFFYQLHYGVISKKSLGVYHSVVGI